MIVYITIKLIACVRRWLVARRFPPSDEGGGFLRSKKTEGETRGHCRINRLRKNPVSLPQSPTVTAPSSEGAKKHQLNQSYKQSFIVIKKWEQCSQ